MAAPDQLMRSCGVVLLQALLLLGGAFAAPASAETNGHRQPQASLATSLVEPGGPSAQWQIAQGKPREFPETYRSPTAPAPVVIDSLTAEERACFDNVRGKVAWNRAGSTQWGDSNILTLCEGTKYPTVRLKCFQSEVQKHDDWKLAVMACKNAEARLQAARPGDPRRFVSCLEQKRREGLDDATALGQCVDETTIAADPTSKAEVGILPTLNDMEQACFNQIQGKVAWNRAGNTQWLESNVRILCEKTPNPEWTVGCVRQQIASHGEAFQAISFCKASSQQALGYTIPPRARMKSPAGVDVGALCTQVFKCALDSAHELAPASICSSCGRGVQSVASLVTEFVEKPSFGAGCAAVNELQWLKETILGGPVAALGLSLCAVNAPTTLGQLCNGACASNCPSVDQGQYKGCLLQCGCQLEEAICQQGTALIAEAACKGWGLRQ